MNFLNPLFLLGLLAVAIPVVLHLINLRRPRRVSFSTLSFFKELQQSTLRRIRIKQYLLMALRAMALLFLAIALARPFLPPSLSGSVNTGAYKSVAIIIDNSPSMSRIGSEGPLIDQAKDVAKKIVENSPSESRFLVSVTNDNRTATVLESRRQSFSAIEEVNVANTAHHTGDVVKAAYKQLQQSSQPHGIIYLISDGQKSQLGEMKNVTLGEQGQASNISLQLVKLEQPRQQNLAITSLSVKNQMLSQQVPLTLAAEVENTGSAAAANQYVSLELDGEIIGEYELTLQPAEKQEVTFEVVPEKVGYLTGKLTLEGDEVTFDNSRYFALLIPESRSVLLINNEEEGSSFKSFLSPALEAAYQTNSQLSVEQAKSEQTDPSQWQTYDTIVLDGLTNIPEYWFQDLQQYVQNGNGILFFPSEEGEVTNYNRFFSRFNSGSFNNVAGSYGSFNTVAKLGDLEGGHPILNSLFVLDGEDAINVESPEFFYYYHYQPSSSGGGMTIIEADNGDPLLTEHHFGEGIILISTIGADPGWSNFPVNPLFAPFYYQSIIYASSANNGGLQQHQLGSRLILESSSSEASEATLNINNIESKVQVQQQINNLQIAEEGSNWTPGLLTVEMGERAHKIGVNQDIMESRFDALEQNQWAEAVGGAIVVNEFIAAEGLSEDRLAAKLNATVFGKEIWNWFIWGALLFLIIETVVSRFYKAETIS